MNATIIARTPTSFTLQVEVPYNDSMLDFEETLQQRLNDAGVVATAEGLQQFDTDGSPITVGPVKFTSKGQVEKDYQTPYGVATVARHVYQSPAGRPDLLPARPGRPDRRQLHAPVRQDALPQVRRVQLAPGPDRPGGEPRPGGLPLPDPGRRRRGGGGGAGQGGGLELRPAEVRGAPRHGGHQPGRDLHADVRGRVAGDDGRHAGFYDQEGERQHTVYLAATPEYGKAKFLGRLEAEIDRAKAKCPEAHYVGIADGAKGNWEFLGRHTDVQVTDFWHAAEYLGKAAAVLYRGQPRTREAWLDDACHRLKHEPGGAEWVLKQLRTLARERPWAKGDEDVQRAITYFANQSGAGRMDYASRVAANEPIGSGVTEAACKVIVKQRLCGSGMKWTEEGAAVVLSLRALSYTPERWSQFWSKVDRWGFPVAA